MEGNCSCSTFGQCHSAQKCIYVKVGEQPQSIVLCSLGSWLAGGTEAVKFLKINKFLVWLREILKIQMNQFLNGKQHNYLQNLHDYQISDSLLSRHIGTCKLQQTHSAITHLETQNKNVTTKWTGKNHRLTTSKTNVTSKRNIRVHVKSLNCLCTLPADVQQPFIRITQDILALMFISTLVETTPNQSKLLINNSDKLPK